METKRRIKIIFSIFGDYFDINEFTEIVGVEPTGAHHKGEKGKYTIYKETAWDYEIITNNEYFDNDLSIEFIKIFEKRKKIIEFREKNNLMIKIFVVFWIKDSLVPGLYLDKKFIAFLNALDAEVDIDGYLDI